LEKEPGDKSSTNFRMALKPKEGGLYYMGGTYIFFLHPKWSKLCTVPLMGPKNPPTKKKLKKNIFDLLFGPFKKVIFALFTLFLGVRKYFFSSKM
jgi:hypothetical protein